jgi:hypothetical protein
MVAGIADQIREIRRGWIRRNDGFCSYYLHRMERVEVQFVAGKPGIPAGYRWQMLGDARFDGAVFVRLADALRYIPAPAPVFGSGKRIERSI